MRAKILIILVMSVGLALADDATICGLGAEKPFLESEFIFPLEHWHNHASCVVEAPNGDLLACWFNGSGERTADDVKILGARKRKGQNRWSQVFTMADTPEYPDTNCTMFIDPQGRLWLLWPTILANRWETALMKYRVASDYLNNGPPKWELSEVLHVTPGNEFADAVSQFVDHVQSTMVITNLPAETQKLVPEHLETLKSRAADKLWRRLGWMTRAHPFVLDNRRLIVPLYSDGFDFSLMAITDDWGRTWRASTPLTGPGNVQPSIVQRKDGSLYTLMRDNGPPPQRLLQSDSFDGGQTWSTVTDSDLPNPGSGAEIISLKNGHWALIGNDTEQGRHSLAVQISDDEGKTWQWKRHLEYDPPGPEAGGFHYPSMIQARDGSLHATYSYHLNKIEVGKDAEELPARKTIKHARFNEAWVMAGD